MRRKLEYMDMTRMRLPERFWDVSLAGVTAGSPGGKTLASRLETYASKMDEMAEQGVGMMLWGPNGTGKTSAACVLLKEACRRGYTALFLPYADLGDLAISQVSFDGSASMIDRASSVRFLVLDDLGKGTEDKTGYRARLLETLLRHRSNERLVTIVTTNVSPKRGENDEPSQLEQLLKSSCMHTLKACIYPIHVPGLDRREVSKREVAEMFV